MNAITASTQSFFVAPVSSKCSTSSCSTSHAFGLGFAGRDLAGVAGVFGGAGVESLMSLNTLNHGWLVVDSASIPAANTYVAIKARKCRPLSRCGPTG